jgi:DNA polymerase (family 10)
MTNQEIASVFQAISDRLELEGENPFRIRAYRKAAMAIGKLKVPVSVLSNDGRLREFLGVGKDLEQKIQELLKTGMISDSGEKKAEPGIPEEAAPFELPGLNPKMARLLHRRFHIETLHDLEQLARSHLLRTVPGLGSSLEKNILEGIEHLKNRQTTL